MQDCSEVGESCAEIVNGDLDAELADLVQEVYHFIEIPDLFRFQNLKGDSLTRPGRQIAEQVVQQGTACRGTDIVGGEVEENGFLSIPEQFQHLLYHQLGQLQIQVIVLGDFQELSRRIDIMILVRQPHERLILGDLLGAVVPDGLEVGDDTVIENGIADDVGHAQLFVHLFHGLGVVLVVQEKTCVVVSHGGHTKLYLFQQVGFADDHMEDVDGCDIQLLAEVIAAFVECQLCLRQELVVRIIRSGGKEERPGVVEVKRQFRIVQSADHLLNVFPHQLIPNFCTTAAGNQNSLFNGNHTDFVEPLFSVIKFEFHEIIQLHFFVEEHIAL